MKKAIWVSGIILFFLMTLILVPITGTELASQQYEKESLSEREAIAYIESKLDWKISEYYFVKAGKKHSLVIHVPAKEQWMYIEIGESMTINYGMLDVWIAKCING